MVLNVWQYFQIELFNHIQPVNKVLPSSSTSRRQPSVDGGSQGVVRPWNSDTEVTSSEWYWMYDKYCQIPFFIRFNLEIELHQVHPIPDVEPYLTAMRMVWDQWHWGKFIGVVRSVWQILSNTIFHLIKPGNRVIRSSSTSQRPNSSDICAWCVWIWDQWH